MSYPWIKTLHILFVTAWMAALFYLPRILVNIGEAGGQAAVRDRLVLMGRRLYRFGHVMFGIALVFPSVALLILDMYPRQRGSASSMQAFVGLVSNAAIAGLLSPLVSHSGLALALTAACFTAVGYALWRWYVSHISRYPDPAAPASSATGP